jgi:hypothetical protein
VRAEQLDHRERSRPAIDEVSDADQLILTAHAGHVE